MSLDQNIKNQTVIAVGSRICDAVWHPVATATYLFIFDALKISVVQTTSRIRLALLPKLNDYDFNK
jgi:hypothetical protein